MTDDLERQTQLLLKKSRLDAQALRFELPSESHGLHAQQCVEKVFKAVIAAHGERFPYTHRLSNLMQMLSALDERPPATGYSPDMLTSFATEFWYEDGPELTPDEGEQMEGDASRILKWAEGRVAALGG